MFSKIIVKKFLTNLFCLQFEDMKENSSLFYENFHMEHTTFERIYGLIEPYLLPKRRSRPDIIDPKLKLAVVLE